MVKIISATSSYLPLIIWQALFYEFYIYIHMNAFDAHNSIRPLLTLVIIQMRKLRHREAKQFA